VRKVYSRCAHLYSTVCLLESGARTSCPPAGEARSDLAEALARESVRATRSDAQDVRALAFVFGDWMALSAWRCVV